MELSTFLTKLKTNAIFLYLNILNGEYLWTDLVQQFRLILKQSGIFAFGVVSALLSLFVFFSVFHESFDSTYMSSK